jgi:hypothetical protein
MTGRAIRSGTVLIDNNFDRELKTRESVVSVGDVAGDQLPQSALSAPMTVMGRTVGCIEVQAQQPDSYRRNTRPLCEWRPTWRPRLSRM